MANAWDDFWGNLTRPISVGPIDEQKRKEVMNTGQGFSNKDQMGDLYARSQFKSSGTPIRSTSNTQQAVDSERLPGMSNGNAPMNPFNGGATRQGMDDQQGPGDDPMKKLMDRRAQLEAMLDEDYTGDPEMDSLINEAYASALGNITGARGRANENFAKSDANIAALSAGHVNTIKTDDLNAVKRIGGELQSGYQQTFDTAKSGMEANRSAELSERTAMLQRLGIQEAGLGNAGQGETEAIERLTENQSGAMRQAQGYQAADEVRNNELASSQASAGVERRSALNKDLQGILGNLDTAESELAASKSQQQIQARTSGKSDYNQRMGAISDSIAGIDERIDSRTDADRDYGLELKKLAQKGTSSGGVFDVIANDFKNRGIDPAPYMEAYSAVAAATPYNSQVDGDKTLWTIRQMKKKNSKLSDSEIARWVNSKDGFGTDKLGTS